MASTSGILSFVDLCAGVGGLSLGFMSVTRQGNRVFRPALLLDSDESARLTMQRNYPEVPYKCEDLRNLSADQILGIAGVSAGELDVLIGGPPCQGFTIIRRNKHLDDPRNELLSDFLRLVKDLQPKAVVMENVKNLLHAGTFMSDIQAYLDVAGYNSAIEVLNAHQYGVPQLRERLFVLAIRKDLGQRPTFPAPKMAPIRFARNLTDSDSEPYSAILSPYISVRDAIGDLPALGAGEACTAYQNAPFTQYQQQRRRKAVVLHNHESRQHSKAFLNKISRIVPGGSNQDLDGRRRFDRGREVKYFSQAYGRLHEDGIAYTITTHFLNPGSGRFTHYRDLRALTVREAARFQSFDDDFVFYGKLEAQQEHVGNAVPPLLAKSIAEVVASTLL